MTQPTTPSPHSPAQPVTDKDFVQAYRQINTTLRTQNLGWMDNQDRAFLHTTFQHFADHIQAPIQLTPEQQTQAQDILKRLKQPSTSLWQKITSFFHRTIQERFFRWVSVQDVQEVNRSIIFPAPARSDAPRLPPAPPTEERPPTSPLALPPSPTPSMASCEPELTLEEWQETNPEEYALLLQRDREFKDTTHDFITQIIEHVFPQTDAATGDVLTIPPDEELKSWTSWIESFVQTYPQPTEEESQGAAFQESIPEEEPKEGEVPIESTPSELQPYVYNPLFDLERWREYLFLNSTLMTEKHEEYAEGLIERLSLICDCLDACYDDTEALIQTPIEEMTEKEKQETKERIKQIVDETKTELQTLVSDFTETLSSILTPPSNAPSENP